MRKKAQATMEFLMSYGWAIMVVLVAIAAISYFGILSPDRFLSNKCIIQAGIACADFEVETNRIIIVLQNGIGDDLTINNLSIQGCNCTQSGTLKNGEKKTFIISGCVNTLNNKFDGNISLEYTGFSGLQHSVKGSMLAKVKSSTGTTSCNQSGGGGGGSDGPLDKSASELSANINSSLPPDWHGAQGGDDNIVLKLFSDVSYDLYLESFTLSWNDPTNSLKHVQHLTEANGWSKTKIYGDVEEFSPVSGVFNDNGDPEANLRIPANEYTVIDDLHFKNNINLPTEFTLTLYFNDSTSTTLSFTIG